MSEVSRRTFSGAVLSASALAAQERGTGDPARWICRMAGIFGRRRWLSSFPARPRRGPGGSCRARRESTSPNGCPRCLSGPSRSTDWSGEKPQLRWIFTGPSGGFTVEAGGGKARLAVRYYDSPGLSKVPPVQPRPGRHPEGLWEESQRRVWRRPESHHGGGRLPVDGAGPVEREGGALVPRGSGCEPAPTGLRGRGGRRCAGRLLPPAVEAATVDVDDAVAVPGDARVGRHHHASGLRGIEPARARRSGGGFSPSTTCCCIASIQPARC